MSPANKIKINYDKENDILYALHSEADPNKTQNVDLDENIVARLKYPTKEVVGFTIDGFSEIFPDAREFSDWQLMEIFDFLLEMINRTKNLQPR